MRGRAALATLLASAVLAVGCAAIDLEGAVGAGGANVGVGIGGIRIGARMGRDGGATVSGTLGGTRSPSRRAPADGPDGGPSGRSGGEPDYVPSAFELTEVPHTLLRKPVASGRLTSGFGVRGGRRHDGVDYAAPAGTPVYAAGDGVIDKIYTSASYGNYIRLRHANDFHTAYAHLAAFAGGLGKGSRVRRGQIIGTVGSTGRSSGTHLHYELAYRGAPIDPLRRR